MTSNAFSKRTKSSYPTVCKPPPPPLPPVPPPPPWPPDHVHFDLDVDYWNEGHDGHCQELFSLTAPWQPEDDRWFIHHTTPTHEVTAAFLYHAGNETVQVEIDLWCHEAGDAALRKNPFPCLPPPETIYVWDDWDDQTPDGTYKIALTI